MPDAVQPADLSFFSTLSAAGSLSAAARELGLTAAAVSKRLSQMEARAGVALVNRTTRRMMLTPEGELYLEHARQILDEIDELSELLGSAKQTPKGLPDWPAQSGTQQLLRLRFGAETLKIESVFSRV